jgi:hypothetical protein
MSEDKKTGCECIFAGLCSRHGVNKTPHQHKLCQTHPGYFQSWEDCRGPGQRFIDCKTKKEEAKPIPQEAPQEVPKAMPSLWQQAKNLTSAVGQHVKSGLLHVPEEVKQSRLDICATCPFLAGDRCSKCGCHLPTKTSWASSKCPDNKW